VLLGGNGSDAASGLALDTAGSVYIAGEASSGESFPVLAGTSAFGGNLDAFAAKFTPAGSLVYSRFVGGSLDDRATAIDVDVSGQAYITGRTESTNFPVVSPVQRTLAGGYDAFVTKLDTTGAVILYSTYFGGSLGSETFPEEAAAIRVDSAGRVYLCGTTPSLDFPIVNAMQPFYGGGSVDAFVVALSAGGNSIVFSTYAGGSALDYGTAISLDAAGNVAFGGYTASTDFPVTSPLFGAGGRYDAFVGSLKTDGTRRYSVVFGGFGDDSVAGMARGLQNSVIAVGATSSMDLPLKNAIQTQNAGGFGAFVLTMMESGQPRIASFTPSSGTGSAQTFTAQITAPDGLQTIRTVHWIVNTTSTDVSSCHVLYVRSSNTFQVLNDAGTAYGAGITPGISSTTGNSQCAINGGTSRVTDSGTGLVIETAMTFRSSFSGSKVVFFSISDTLDATGWQIVGNWTVPQKSPGTFNRLLWQDMTTRQAVLWTMGGIQGTNMQSWAWIAEQRVPGWFIVAWADLNADGTRDAIWQNDVTRQVSVWYLGGAQGTTFIGSDWISEALVPGWRVVGAADLNGDGRPDLVWQNDTTGQVSVWYMGGVKGNVFQSSTWLSSIVLPDWKVVGVSDLDGDGKPDLIWQHNATRQVSYWLIAGAQGNTFVGSGWLSSSSIAGWHIVGACDINGDGKTDLVWQHDATQQASVWFMGGHTGNHFPKLYMDR
jgi:hypothetical protein